MSVITAVTKLGERHPLSDSFEQVYLVVIANSAKADEWFVTDFTYVTTVTSHVVVSDTNRNINVVLRNQGTGGAAAANNAAVGVESTAACSVIFTVRGK